MNKTMKIDTIEMIYARIVKEWPEMVKELHLSNKSLYNLVALKRELEKKHDTIQETVATIMRSHGAVENENGALQLSKEGVAEANKELNGLATQEEEIEYNLITVREEDSIPPTLMELFYDFIVIE